MQTPTDRLSLRPFTDQFFQDCCKPKSQHRVGMEVEHICIRSIDGQRIPYDTGDGCVITLLDDLESSLGGETVFRGELRVGLQGDWGMVTLEPGNQIEWSSPPRTNCHELISDLNHWLTHFNDVIRRHGVMSLSSGLDRTSICHVPWVPKRRYNIMRDHYEANAEIAHRAMLNTAGVHVSFDFEDDADWNRKFRALTLATPAAVALFANSPGELRHQRYAALRPVLWLEMDEHRSSLPADAFDAEFSLDSWAEWVTSRPMLLREVDGKLQPGEGQSLNSAFDSAAEFETAWKLHAGSIFTPVRTHMQLEVRTIDTQPDDRLAAVPAFWTGLIYDDAILNRVLETVGGISSEATWRNHLYRACRFGMEDVHIEQQASELLGLAVEGLAALEGSDSQGVAALLEMRESLARAKVSGVTA